MAFTVKLFNFAKKENSTEQPQEIIKAQYELGGLQFSDGQESTVNFRARTSYIDTSIYTIGFSLPQGYKYGFFFYNSNYGYISWDGWRTSSAVLPTPPANTRYIRIVFGLSNDAVVTETDLALLSSVTNLIPQHPAVGLALSDIVLLDSCSVVNPILVINVNNLARQDVFNFNYCYIAEFSRYYFIVDWSYSGGLWIATCRVDPLASWKSEILAQTFYIMRSTYDSNNQILFDGGVADGKYPVTTEKATYTASSVANPYAVDNSLSLGGSFVVGIINSRSQNGAVSYYAMTPSAFLDFCQKMFTYSTGWLDIDPDEISESLQKALVNPFQYVASCIYLPIDITAIPGYTSTSTIYFGWWSVTMTSSAKIVNSGMYVTTSTSLTIPRHPQAASRGKYLNVSPYSIYTLRYYPYGTLDIDSEAIASWSTLDLYSSVDVITGKGVLDISVNGRANMIRTVEANVGVQVPTASLQTNFTNIAAGKAGVIAAGASLVGKLNNVGGNVPNPADYSYNLKGFAGFTRDTLRNLGQDVKEAIAPAGSIKQTATDILNSAVAASTTAEIQGMQGAGSLYQEESLSLSGRFLPIVTEDFIHTGRPLMQSRQLSTLSGFCICKDADCDFAATAREKAAIEAYLTGGFFIE